ncbi:MAG: TlpA disulfide reductase family protein, partial [Bacteroidales bacterium]
IRLLAFDDLINANYRTVAKDIIDQDGRFHLSYNTNHIELVQLAINTSKAEFFIVPSHEYVFDIEMDPQLFQLLDPTQYGGYLQIKNSFIDTADLNYKINRFSNFFEKVLDYYSFRLFVDLNKEVLDTVHDVMKSKFPYEYEPDNFYLSYVYYSYGSVDRIIYNKAYDSLYHVYFDNEYLLYHNPAYMNLFNSFYSNYLYNSPRISKSTITQYINDKPDFMLLFNEVGKDPLLVNEKIRELVLIKNLGQFYENEEFDKANVIKLLEFVKANSRFPEHRQIALNTLASFDRLEKIATEKDNIVFQDAAGKNVKIQKLSGKWVYIQFFQTNCADCIREMLIMKDLHDKYKEDIDFVSISLDADKIKLTNFVSHYPMFDWSFLHFNNQYDWLDQLGVKTLPDYLLLDPEGKIALRYAPSPEKELPKFLYEWFYKEEADKNPLFYPRK